MILRRDMDTKTMTREVRLLYWAEIIRERNESGKSIRMWCKENSIVEKTYYYWQRQLRQAACERLSEIKSASNQIDLPQPSFAEVRLMSLDSQLALAQTIQPNQIQVEIHGIKITADSTYPEHKLAYLLRELVRSC